MNSKYLAGQKQNLNTFIRESPPSSSEQKVHGFLFLKEFTSVCDLSANRGFWLQPLILLSPAGLAAVQSSYWVLPLSPLQFSHEIPMP